MVFLKLSLISFGGVFGVLPELERDIVTKFHWLTHDQFIQTFVLAQVVPGPNMVMCPMIGYRIAGLSGFIAGFFGIYSMPLVIMGGAFYFYHRYRNLAFVRKLELGLRPLVLGLIASSAIQLWWEQSSTLLSQKFPALALSIAITVAGIFWMKSRKVNALVLIFSAGMVGWVGHILVDG